MPLDQATLKAAIIAASNAAQAETDVNASKNVFADHLATAIITCIQSGLVTVTVATTGTAAAQSGGGTGNIT